MLQGTLDDAESTTFRLEVQLCEEPKLAKTPPEAGEGQSTCQAPAKVLTYLASKRFVTNVVFESIKPQSKITKDSAFESQQ